MRSLRVKHDMHRSFKLLDTSANFNNNVSNKMLCSCLQKAKFPSRYTVIENCEKVCRGDLSTLYKTDEIEYIFNVLIIDCVPYISWLQPG